MPNLIQCFRRCVGVFKVCRKFITDQVVCVCVLIPSLVTSVPHVTRHIELMFADANNRRLMCQWCYNNPTLETETD